MREMRAKDPDEELKKPSPSLEPRSLSPFCLPLSRQYHHILRIRHTHRRVTLTASEAFVVVTAERGLLLLSWPSSLLLQLHSILNCWNSPLVPIEMSATNGSLRYKTAMEKGTELARGGCWSRWSELRCLFPAPVPLLLLKSDRKYCCRCHGLRKRGSSQLIPASSTL
ncbi:uncharacterized protein DS421_18g624460 [Arachis hypogaea]|nr:uncharacterized protein DS421_18g624460 [Arachis hypogaea]